MQVHTPKSMWVLVAATIINVVALPMSTVASTLPTVVVAAGEPAASPNTAGSSSSNLSFSPSPITEDPNSNAIDNGTGNATPENTAAVQDPGSDFLQKLGRFHGIATSSQKLAIDGYDLNQIQAMNTAYNALVAAGSATLQQYANDGPAGKLPDAILHAAQLSDQPNIDVRAIKTLLYLTTPVADGGAGLDWLRVTSIARGYQTDSNQWSQDQAQGANPTKSPHHYGEGITISEIGKLKGTKFTYEVDVPQDQASQLLDPSKVDYSQARIVDKQQVADVPIQAGWQTNAGAAGNQPDLSGGSMNSILTNTALSQVGQSLTNNGADCVAAAGTLPSSSTPSLVDQLGLGCLTQAAGNAALAFGGSFLGNSHETGANALHAMFPSIPANAFGISNPAAGVTPQLVMGAASVANSMGISPIFLTDPKTLSSQSRVVAAVGQGSMTKELNLWDGRNEFANLPNGDKNAFAKAVGLGWLENQVGIQRNINPGDLSDTKSDTYQALFGTSDSTFLNALGSNKEAVAAYTALQAGHGSADDLYLAIGNGVLTDAQTKTSAKDALYGITIGKADGTTNNNDRFTRMVNGDQSVWLEIGASRIASSVSNEPSMQDAIYQALATGQTPTDSNGLSTVDYRGIDTRLNLQPGDFKAIFLDGQGWSVLSRQGLVQYATMLSGQAQALGNQASTMYSGSFVTDQLNTIKNQGLSLVTNLQNQLKTAPSQALGSVVSTLQAQLNGIDQGVYNQINARLAHDSQTNPADATFRSLQGSIGLLAGSGTLSPANLTALYQLNNAISQGYAPGANLVNPSQWTGGSFGGSGVVSQNDFVNAFIAGQNASLTSNSQNMNWMVTSLGLEQMYNSVFASATQPLVGTLNSAAAFVNTARLAIQGAGYALGSFDPSNILISPTKQQLYNFVMQDLVAGTPAAAWAQEINLAYKLTDDPNYKLTDSDVMGLLTGTSVKALTMLGAKQVDIAYGLSAVTPFISVITGKQDFNTAATNAAMQTGFQYLYGFSNQFTSGNPTANAALQIVLEESMGAAHDSLSNSKTFISQNDPATLFNLIPTDVALKQTIDPVGYAQAKAKINAKFAKDPTAYHDQMVAALQAKNLPADIADFATGKLTTDDLVSSYKSSQGNLADIDPAVLAKRIAGDPNDAHYADTLAKATDMFTKLKSGDEAGARAAALTITTNQLGDQMGSAEDILDAHLGRLGARLADLGLADIDAQIQSLTGVPNVLRSFYKSNNPTDVALALGWNALTQYVHFPPELLQTLNYFGGDPLSIAKSFTDGRAGAAFGALAAGQLYTVTQDAGISIAAGDFLAAQFGPSVAQMQQINAQAKAAYDDAAKQYDHGVDVQYQKNPILSSTPTPPNLISPVAPTPATTGSATTGQTVDETATNDAIAAAKAAKPTVLLSQQDISNVLTDRIKQQATKNFQYAMMDYAATLSIRTASGNQAVSMSGFAKAMLEGTPQDQAQYLINVLSGFTNGELSQYLGDAVAAGQIYQYLHDVSKPVYIDDATGTGVLPADSVKVPAAAFSYLDGRLSQLMGWQVPAGFSQGLVSFARTGDFGAKLGNLPSMKDILSSTTVQMYVGNWLDKQAGIPAGTSFTLYQLAQQAQVAQEAVQTANLAAQTEQAALAGAQFGTTSIQAATAAGAAAVETSAPDLLAPTATTGLTNAGTTAGGTAATVGGLTPGQIAANTNLAAVYSTAAKLVVNLAFSKQFSQMDESLGLPPGTVSTLVGTAITAGIGLLVNADLVVLFGGGLGPIGIALLAAGFLSGFLFQSGKKAAPPVTRQFTRTFYSDAGLNPGFESKGLDGFNTTAVPGSKPTALDAVPASDITQTPALSAYTKAPTPVANQPLTQPKATVRFLVTDPTGKPLSGSVAVVNPKASQAASGNGSGSTGPKPYDITLGDNVNGSLTIQGTDLTTTNISTPVTNGAISASVALDPKQTYTADFVPADPHQTMTTVSLTDGNVTPTNTGVAVTVKPAATNQPTVVPIGSDGILGLPAIAQGNGLDLTFTLNKIDSNPQGSYDGAVVNLTQGADKIVVAPANGVVKADGSIAKILNQNDIATLNLGEKSALTDDQTKTAATNKPVALSSDQAAALGLSVADAPTTSSGAAGGLSLDSLFGGSTNSKKVVVGSKPVDPKPTELKTNAYDGGSVTLSGPSLGSLTTIKDYTPGTNVDPSQDWQTIVPPTAGLTATTGAKILKPGEAVPEGSDPAFVQPKELLAQQFTNPMNPMSFPLAPATFEANTSAQFQSHAPNVAQFKLSGLIGQLLYMPDRINSGSSENANASPTSWFIRPSRIQSYGTNNQFLDKFTIPRYEPQLDRLYGYQADDGSYRDALPANKLYGLGANDHWSQAIDVTW